MKFEAIGRISPVRRRWIEIVLVSLVALSFVWLFAGFRLAESYRRVADNLAFEQILDNIRLGAGVTSDIFSSTLKLINSGALTMDADAYAAAVSDFDITKNSPILDFHTYYIMYAVYPLTYLFSARAVVAVLAPLCFVALIVIAYAWLRSKKVDVFGAGFFCLLVMLHPAWGASIGGQFYPDRIFLPLALLFYIAIHQKWFKSALVSGVIALTVTERAPSVLGLFLIGYAVFFFRPHKLKPSLCWLALGLALIALGWVIQNKFIVNLYYGSFMPVSFGDLMARFSDPNLRGNLWLFLSVNGGLLFLCAFEPRTLPIVVGLMLPNILGNIGGAEKTGFSTHYHTYYLPSLVWGAALGYGNLHRRIVDATAKWRLYPAFVPFAVIFACLPVFYAHFIDWGFNKRIRLSLQFASTNNLILSIGQNWRESFGRDGKGLRTARDQMLKSIPPGSVVSAPEAAMWVVGQSSRVFIYPLAMAHATHLAVMCEPGDMNKWTAVASFLSPERKATVERDFREKARGMGFDVDNPACGPAPFGIGIISRRS